MTTASTARMATSNATTEPRGLSAFDARTACSPLWANLRGRPGIWIRWTEAHEDQVESDQALTFGNRTLGYSTVGRLVRCGKYGEWYIGDWRPVCGTCRGSGQVLLTAGDDDVRPACVRALVDTVDAGLLYMTHADVMCPDCRPHPGWVVG